MMAMMQITIGDKSDDYDLGYGDEVMRRKIEIW